MTFLLDVLALISFVLLLQTLQQLKRDWHEFWDDAVTTKDQHLAKRLAIFALLPLSVLLHEIGHAIATWQSGGTVSAFQWRFTWGYIIPSGSFNPFQDWWIALSGNLISILLLLASLLLIPRIRKRIIAEILFFFACAQAVTSVIAYPLLSLSNGWGDWPKIYNPSMQPYAILTLLLHVGLVVVLWRLYHSDKALLWRLRRNPAVALQYLSLRSEVNRHPANLNLLLSLVELLRQQHELHAARLLMHNLPLESSKEIPVQLMRAFLAASPRKSIKICQPLLASDLLPREHILLDRVLSSSYLNLGNLATALSYANHGLSLSEDQPNLRWTRANIYFRLKRTPEALADLEAAINHVETEDMRWYMQQSQKKIEKRARIAGQPLKLHHFILAGLGFIPMLGLPFALISVVWGFSKLKGDGGTLLILGVLGPVLSLVLVVGAISLFF
jgi:tetratricopeptide (TPR) repeat protein